MNFIEGCTLKSYSMDENQLLIVMMMLHVFFNRKKAFCINMHIEMSGWVCTHYLKLEIIKVIAICLLINQKLIISTFIYKSCPFYSEPLSFAYIFPV